MLVTPSRRGFPLRWHGVLFSSAPWDHKKTLTLFREKGPVTASLQRPWRWYWASMAFYCVPTELLCAIHCALTTLSLRYFTALTMRALRFHGVRIALTACWGRSDISKNVVKSPCKRHEWPRRLHNDTCVLPRSIYCVGGDLTARLWWPNGDRTALL